MDDGFNLDKFNENDDKMIIEDYLNNSCGISRNDECFFYYSYDQNPFLEQKKEEEIPDKSANHQNDQSNLISEIVFPFGENKDNLLGSIGCIQDSNNEEEEEEESSDISGYNYLKEKLNNIDKIGKKEKNIFLDSTIDDSEIRKKKKIYKYYNENKSAICSCANNNISSISTKKQPFVVMNSSVPNIYNSVLNSSNISSCCLSSLNNIISLCDNNQTKSNMDYNDNIKTELIDKSFIRKFKKFLESKMKKNEKIFKNDSFLINFIKKGNSSFSFDFQGEKRNFKSINQPFLRMIFSKKNARNLYKQFIKAKIVDILKNYKSQWKKQKKLSMNRLLFYEIYGGNLYKIYSDEYKEEDINFNNLEVGSL